jgi:hypothetical protein
MYMPLWVPKESQECVQDTVKHEIFTAQFVRNLWQIIPNSQSMVLDWALFTIECKNSETFHVLEVFMLNNTCCISM